MIYFLFYISYYITLQRHEPSCSQQQIQPSNCKGALQFIIITCWNLHLNPFYVPGKPPKNQRASKRIINGAATQAHSLPTLQHEISLEGMQEHVLLHLCMSARPVLGSVAAFFFPPPPLTLTHTTPRPTYYHTVNRNNNQTTLQKEPWPSPHSLAIRLQVGRRRYV